MKLNLLALLVFPVMVYSQEVIVGGDFSKNLNTFTSGVPRYEKFNNKARLFNDWAISVGGGTALMKYADLTSFYGNRLDWGWNAYVSLDKQITHTFGLSLQYQQGETNQKAMLKESYGVAEGKTKYRQVSILGDINFSNLLRRIDNNSPYRWALHGYAGLGVQGFDTKLTDHADGSDVEDWFVTKGGTMHQDLGIASFFFQGGLGLKYKISRIVDLEARVMYIITEDDEFDGGGDANASTNQKIAYIHSDYLYNSIKKNNSDNFFTANLGLTFKLGKHISHLTWYDPLQETFYKINLLENRKVDLNVCEKGDLDNDGVCDDWDRQLDTPSGARVDGAGVALDIDLDGVIDLNDRCVTIPGTIENEGCPETRSIEKSKSF